MPINILMPALSPTMTEGTLAKWLKQEGDDVASGDALAEIETDKATMEVEAVDEGKMGKILVAEGTEGVAVNSVIAVLLAEGEDASALDAAAAPPPAPAAAPAAEAPAPAAPSAAARSRSPLASRRRLPCAGARPKRRARRRRTACRRPRRVLSPCGGRPERRTTIGGSPR